MDIIEAIKIFNIPKDMFYLKKEGFFFDFVLINNGQYLYFYNNCITYQNKNMFRECKSTKKEIKNYLLKSNRYKEHLRKKLRKKKLRQLNDK